MKKLSKLLALIMVMTLAFSLVGCGDTSDQVLGTWELSYDLSSELSAALLERAGDDYADFNAELMINMRLQFNDDGTYRMYWEEESTKANYEQWLNELVDYDTDMLYTTYEGQGFSREEVDEQAQEQYGCSLRDYVMEQRQDAFDIDAFIASGDSNGVYKAKGNKLYMGETETSPNTYELFTVEGDTLTLDAATEEIAEQSSLNPGFEYPIVFKKVD